MAVCVCRQALQQFKPQLLAGTAGGTGVGLVHHDALGCDGEEVLAVALALDVVQADDDHRMVVKQAHTVGQLPLQTTGTGGRQCHSEQVEALLEFALPLLHQMGWAQHGHALDFASVHQFPDDQRSLDGLANADVVANQQPHGGQPQGHEQGHELICTRLHSNVAEAAEGTGTGAQLQAQGIAQQQGCGVVAHLGRVGLLERGGLDGTELLQFRQQRDHVVVGAPKGAQAQGAGTVSQPGVGLDHPLAATGPNKVARQELGGDCCHRLAEQKSGEQGGVGGELLHPPGRV